MEVIARLVYKVLLVAVSGKISKTNMFYFFIPKYLKSHEKKYCRQCF